MKVGTASTRHLSAMSFRIDPSLHLSEGLRVREYLTNSPYELLTINDVTEKVFLGNIFSRVFVKDKEHGKTYLAASDTVLANIETGRYLSNKQVAQLKHLCLQKDWILVTCSGTLGNVTYTNKTFEGKIATHDLIRIVPNDNHVKKGVVYAFLASKYGYYQITQSQFGGVVKHTNDKQVGAIVIPNFPESFQIEIDDLIQESARLREEATEALEQAVSMFEKEIGQSNLSLGHQCGSVSSSAISDKFIRFDSQYQLGYQTLQKEKRALSTEKISTFAKNIYIGNRDKRNYVENGGIPFLSSSDMMLANPKRSCKQLSKRASNLSTLLVSKGTILISRSGTVGNTIIVGDTIDGCAVSEHAMRLVIDEDRIAPEYVFAYFKTKQGQNSLKILPYGSVIVTLGEDFLGNVDLPILTKEKQDMITELVKMYITKSDKAVTNENLAISKVEQEIERWNHQ